jgi:type I restriction-modification system DNA methylase subunit
MENPTSVYLDLDLTRQDIQGLSSGDAVTAFFARLGYDTETRTLQTAGNLGITADSTSRPIKKIELIANQEGLLQVYLFELQSITVAHTRALARAFRNRAGNYVLVLTSDYERLDFVFLERELPTTAGREQLLSDKQSAIRPRVLTVERRNPTPIQLRVLRRLTWTESDPYYQYEKLKAAYELANWSEDYFNNRALFSDYYLKERLKEFPVWKDDPKPAYLKLRELYQRAASRFAGKEKRELYRDLVRPVLDVLGFAAQAGKSAQSPPVGPHHKLYSPRSDDSVLALCQVYPWDRSLDGKDDRRDKETPEENPGAVVVTLLETGETSWIVVTNGRLWRLYSQRTHARATNYYEIDLDEVLSQSGPHALEIAESFRYFWLLFRSDAFEPVEIEHQGKKRLLSRLDELLLYSEDYAKELGERLKERIFEDIFPHLAAGFIASIRQRDGAHADISQDALNTVYQGTLTLLYRLLFLLYAESRDLLPVKEVRGYFEASLTKLKQEVAETAGNIEDEVEDKFKKHYRDDEYRLYNRLLRLCRIIDKGDPALNVPVYNGGLFLSEPEENDHSPEADAARFLNQTKVPDRFLGLAIDFLTRSEDQKRHDLVFIDFKSLGVRQLGSIYEGLLKFKLRIAERKLGIVKEKGRDVYADFSKLEEKIRERLERQDRIKKKGQVYLENDKHERKATGSYYTPDHIVQYIVEHAVGPILKEKFDAMRPKLREAQQKRRAFFDKQEALRKQGLRPEPESKAEFIGQELVEELFNIKVLDMAMGSGHFLVETVDYITDKMLDFLNGFPWNPVIAQLSRMRETILQEMEDQGITIDPKRLTDVNLLKRHVLKRCIYGVDINPMAVELAKVSLWLDCFTLGAPLSFLDHHLRCGNSLIGATVDEIDKIRAAKGQLLLSASSDWQGLLQAIQGMIEVGGLPDVTSAQVARSRSTYKSALSNLENFKKILDVHTARWFVELQNGKRKSKKAKPKEDPFDYILKSGDLFDWSQGKKAPLLDVEPYRSLLPDCARIAKEKRFFHWELEFPEVFYGPRAGTTQAIERLQGAGFDAVIGNPPYDVLASEELGYDVSDDLIYYEALQVYEPAIRGKKNLYKMFICRAVDEIRAQGVCSFIVPMPLLGDDQAAGVRKMLFEKTRFTAIEVFPQKDDPHDRVFPEAKLATCVFVCRGTPSRERFQVRTHPGRVIEETSLTLRISAEEILKFDPENVTIPSCTQRDWEIAIKILANEKIGRLRDHCQASQGEVNETTDGKKDFISSNPKDGPQILRGSNICMYVLREASQGEAIYLRKEKYLKGKPDSVKALHHQQRRVGWQESSPQNNFRRIIAAAIPDQSFCNHLINYIPEQDSNLPLDLLLALFNSKLLDWYFRLGSTNAHVSHYQVEILPCPTLNADGGSESWAKLLSKSRWFELQSELCTACKVPGLLPSSVANTIAEMSHRIQKIEEKRLLKNRSERSRLAPESQPIQDAIDGVLFRCYGLSDDEARYIGSRLKEML